MRNRTLSGASAVPVVASPSTDLKRRRFLFSLGAGGAAAAATAAMPGAGVAQVATTDSADTGSGYRETKHVRDYYRTAKL